MSHPALTHHEPAARIKQLCTQGNMIDVDGKIPLRRYFRSGQELVRMAHVYEEEGSLENSFILYMKFMTLFIEKIRTHPEYHAYSAKDKAANNKRVKEILPIAERLKSQLREKYQREYNVFLQEQLKADEEARQREEEEAEERRKKTWLDKQRKQEEEQEEMAEERRIHELKELQALSHRRMEDGGDDLNVVYPIDQLIGGEMTHPAHPIQHPTTPSAPYMPSRDLKPMSVGVVPQIDRTSKPTSLLGAKSGALREVRVPGELMPTFMSLAHRNTTNNIETCGVLAGHLAQHRLLITHLLIPKQCATADSCTTQQEEELFDHQDKLDLITIGWIHTHPSQTAFLSSVDLHTHCSYQLMMPEAIAIVCAPKYQETGFFTLTPHHGLPFIAECQQSGFHPHPKEPPLFQNADHVTMDGTLKIKVIDLRNT